MPRLQHEGDESRHSEHSGPREEVKQAGRDVERGLENTDRYATRGQREPKRRQAGGKHNAASTLAPGGGVLLRC